MILKDGYIYPELWDAKKRGVIFDGSEGLFNFSFTIARQAIQNGLLPDVLGTDLNNKATATVQSLPVVMSHFLNLGLTIDQIIPLVTINPAEALNEEKYRGSLKVGMTADISVLEVLEGDYLFSDGKGGGSLKGTKLIEPRMVIKNGQEIPCYSRYHPSVSF